LRGPSLIRGKSAEKSDRKEERSAHDVESEPSNPETLLARKGHCLFTITGTLSCHSGYGVTSEAHPGWPAPAEEPRLC